MLSHSLKPTMNQVPLKGLGLTGLPAEKKTDGKWGGERGPDLSGLGCL